MKTLLWLLMCVLHLGVKAQPDLDRNYCGFAPNDSIDITHDGIPDLVVLGARSGTDDEPSSSGTCMLYVMNLPGTALLNTRDAQGHWRIMVCSKGDSIPAIDTKPQNDFEIPRTLYTDGSIQVAYWGYGHQSPLVTVTPNLGDQFYVFQTISNDRAWHGSFSITPPDRMDKVSIRVGAFLPADKTFVVQ
jgi:hypothetical protein